MKHVSILFVFTFIYCCLVNAQPGTLDKSYANGGTFTSGNLHCNISSSAIQQDDKVIAGGADWSRMDSTAYLLIRHKTDGSVDSSFGEKGIAAIQFVGFMQNGWSSVKVQQDGKIVAAGFWYAAVDNPPPGGDFIQGDIVVARFNRDGSLDASFGENGLAVTDLGRNEEIHDMALQPDGKIVLVGTSDSKINYLPMMLVVRYTADGILDNSFGEDKGYSIYPERSDVANAVAIQEDSKIIVGGTYGAYERFMLLRYLPDGTLDDGFGIHGRVLTRFNDEGFYLNINHLLIDKAHNILAGGIAEGDRMTVVRYKTDGTPDGSFGKGGVVIINPSGQQSRVNTMFFQEDKILLTGGAGPNAFTAWDIALARLLPDGTLDSSFGTNGQTITDLGLWYEGVNHAVMQQDGKVVIAGNSSKGDDVAYYLARYDVTSERQPLIVRIKRWLQHRGISWQTIQKGNNIRYYAVQCSTDGITYKEVARVSSKTNIYEDAAPATTDAYYRIAAVGWDGSRTYSNTVLITNLQEAKIFPNPVRNNLQVQGLPVNGKTAVSIVDWNGNVRNTATATGTSYSVNTANLNRGSYLLKIQHNGTTTTQPFVKE